MKNTVTLYLGKYGIYTCVHTVVDCFISMLRVLNSLLQLKLLLEDIYYNSGNIKVVSENYLKFQFIR
jgi:hypothetical protein